MSSESDEKGAVARLRQWWLDRRTTEVTLPNGDRLLKVRGKLTPEQVDDLLARWVGRCGDSPDYLLGHESCAMAEGHSGWHRAESGTEWSRSDNDVADCAMCVHGCHPIDCPYMSNRPAGGES